MVRISRVDSAAGHNQLDEPPGLLQNAYGLLVGDVAVQRLAVDRQDLVALLEAAISETQRNKAVRCTGIFVNVHQVEHYTIVSGKN